MKNFAILLYLSAVYAIIMLIAYQLGINYNILLSMGAVGVTAIVLPSVSKLANSVKKLMLTVHLPRPVFNFQLKK